MSVTSALPNNTFESGKLLHTLAVAVVWVAIDADTATNLINSLFNS